MIGRANLDKFNFNINFRVLICPQQNTFAAFLTFSPLKLSNLFNSIPIFPIFNSCSKVINCLSRPLLSLLVTPLPTLWLACNCCLPLPNPEATPNKKRRPQHTDLRITCLVQSAVTEHSGIAAHWIHIMSSDMLKSIPFPIPTLDRPFGVELWPIFDQIYTSVMGYSPKDFRFVPGETPISTLKATVILLSTYYITVFAGREFMKHRTPLNLNVLFMVHNLYLTIISGTLLALFIEQLLPTVWRNGIFFAICDARGGWTEPLVVLYYVSTDHSISWPNWPVQLNYLTKYVELIDTVFMFLKKKPLSTSYDLVDKHQLTWNSFSTYLPSRCNSITMLHSIDWHHCCFVGSYRPQPTRTCRHVLVLFPKLSWCARVVEEMDYTVANRPICHWPRWVLSLV